MAIAVEGALLERGDLKTAAARDAHGAHVEGDADRQVDEDARIEAECHSWDCGADPFR